MRALIAIAALAAAPSAADASCLDVGVPSTPEYPYGFVPSFPANGLFFAADSWLQDGKPLELVVDDGLSQEFLATVHRPTMALVPGTTFVVAETGACARPCSTCMSPCAEWRLVIDEADVVAPTAPSVDVHTLLVRNPASGGSFSCADVDKLELDIAASDNTTTSAELTFGAVIAPTAAEVDSASAFTVTFGYDRGEDTPTTATIVLGESVGRKRDGAPFAAAGPFCFALQAFDRSGNISERSATTCLDTTNGNDPTVEWVESSEGCACDSTNGSGGWVIALSFVCQLFRRNRRRRRAPSDISNVP